MTAPGLRERKKQATKQRLAQVAVELFAERGFEQVTVGDIAAAADVSPATVFNYFPTKEDLIYDGMASFHEQLLAAVHDRDAGTSVITAFREHLLQPRGLLADPDPDAQRQLATVARVIAASPTLQARERLESDRAAATLRELLVAEAGADDLRAWAVAAALVGITRGMSEQVRAGSIAGRKQATLRKAVLAAGRDAIAAAERAWVDTTGAAPSR